MISSTSDLRQLMNICRITKNDKFIRFHFRCQRRITRFPTSYSPSFAMLELLHLEGQFSPLQAQTIFFQFELFLLISHFGEQVYTDYNVHRSVFFFFLSFCRRVQGRISFWFHDSVQRCLPEFLCLQLKNSLLFRILFSILILLILHISLASLKSECSWRLIHLILSEFPLDCCPPPAIANFTAEFFSLATAVSVPSLKDLELSPQEFVATTSLSNSISLLTLNLYLHFSHNRRKNWLRHRRKRRT